MTHPDAAVTLPLDVLEVLVDTAFRGAIDAEDLRAAETAQREINEVKRLLARKGVTH